MWPARQYDGARGERCPMSTVCIASIANMPSAFAAPKIGKQMANGSLEKQESRERIAVLGKRESRVRSLARWGRPESAWCEVHGEWLWHKWMRFEQELGRRETLMCCWRWSRQAVDSPVALSARPLAPLVALLGQQSTRRQTPLMLCK